MTPLCPFSVSFPTSTRFKNFIPLQTTPSGKSYWALWFFFSKKITVGSRYGDEATFQKLRLVALDGSEPFHLTRSPPPFFGQNYIRFPSPALGVLCARLFISQPFFSKARHGVLFRRMYVSSIDNISRSVRGVRAFLSSIATLPS